MHIEYVYVCVTGCKMQLVHTLSGQSSVVLCCAYSADGQLLVSGWAHGCYSPGQLFTSCLVLFGVDVCRYVLSVDGALYSCWLFWLCRRNTYTGGSLKCLFVPFFLTHRSMDKTVTVYEAVSESFINRQWIFIHYEIFSSIKHIFCCWNSIYCLLLQNDGVLLYTLNQHER